MTTASDELAKHQKACPPRYAHLQGLDRAQQLYQNLVPVLPPRISDLFSNGLVAVGEVGRNNPDIQTIQISGGGSVIEFNSGMMDFVYTVARGLAGRSVRRTASGPENQEALSLPDVVRQIGKVFMQWKWYRRWLWKLRRIRYPEFHITENTHRWVEANATLAELFMLSHEIGHIVLEQKILPPLTANAELNADTIGLELIANLVTKRGEDINLVFAGAVFAIRIFAGLEKVGVRFSSAYPPQAERIANISACMLSLCPSRQYFHEISRVAVSYQDIMDDVENHIVRRTAPVKPDTERITVRLIAELLDVALGRLPKKKFIAYIIQTAEETSPDMMRQVVDTLKKYYVDAPQDEPFLDQDIKKKMGALIIEILSELPEQVRVMLEK